MVRKLALGIACLAIVAASGCSGNGGSSSGPLSAKQIAAKAGCTLKGYGRSSQLYAKATYRCGSDGEINIFSTTALRDSWLKVAEGFGGSYVVGDTWEIDGFGPARMSQIAKATGGTPKP